MWLIKHKKKLVAAVFVLVILGLLYFLSICYFLTNGFRNYEKFCSLYIPQIEQFKITHGFYPLNILELDKPSSSSLLSWRYDAEQCNYIADPDGFSFQVSDGFIGIGIYLSNEKRWVYD